MAEERRALSTIPPELPAGADYDAICSAVMASARGRWFLAEYAKRNRSSDTSQVLTAIERIESVVAGGRAREASQEVRIELLEMARAIAQTRAEVAESHSPAPPAASAPSAHEPDIAGAAGRLRDIARTMRACGLELGTSQQIEQIAEVILSASALRDPGDQRAGKLAEVLHYLEHRIDRMLDNHLAVTSVAASDVEATGAEQASPGVDGAARAQATEPAPTPDIADEPNEIDGKPVNDGEAPAPKAVLTILLDAMAVAQHVPAAADEPDSVTMQVEQDLQALAELPPGAALPDATETEAAPSMASSVAVPGQDGSSANVRATTILAHPVEEKPEDPRPIPSMWEPPARDAAGKPTRHSDTLAALAAMTDEERIALFT